MQLELIDVSKSFGGPPAVQSLSLSVAHGECVALLGPSGCGKSTTLSMIAGFTEPDRGRILIGGRPARGIPAERRNIGVVFQNYALFPHLSVFDNVAYGLHNRRVGRADIHRRVKVALDLVRLAELGDRYPRQLSGGQQQRVAVARAIVIEPDLLLLDEPLSNLDARLRAEMQVELSDIIRHSRVTTVFVTHDQQEAMVVADRIAIMRNGAIEQVGTAREVYYRPANAFVAGFVGNFNAFAGVVERHGSEGTVEVLGDCGAPITAAASARSFPIGIRVTVAVRPERVRLLAEGEEVENRLSGRVDKIHFLGNSLQFRVRSGPRDILVTTQDPHQDRLTPGAEVELGWGAGDCVVLPEATNAA